MKVGIDAISTYIPKLYLPIKVLAEKRNIESAKLEKGLGLKNMSVIDVHEDTASMAANALYSLIEQEDINPKEIHRVYVGTESGLDSSKPVASYALKMVENLLEKDFGFNAFKHVDSVDLTFACIGAIDALENCLDFVRCNPNKKAIVIASDYAKYSLDSTGEYTQGAGAIAMLVTANPSILAFQQTIGISTNSVFDFFKPRRILKSQEAIQVTKSPTQQVEIFLDEPVFDGQYSNECYKARLKEAYFNFKEQVGFSGKLFERWDLLAFHLPYAYQGRRMFSEIYAIENGETDLSNENLKTIAKSEDYRNFVQQTIEPTERASSNIGNMYTASIFMAMLSGLKVRLEQNAKITGSNIGLLAYGSGSKSKVLEAQLQSNWKEKIKTISLFEDLNNRVEITYETYELLHRKAISSSVEKNYKGFGLDKIESENQVLIGARYYIFK